MTHLVVQPEFFKSVEGSDDVVLKKFADYILNDPNFLDYNLIYGVDWDSVASADNQVTSYEEDFTPIVFTNDDIENSLTQGIDPIKIIVSRKHAYGNSNNGELFIEISGGIGPYKVTIDNDLEVEGDVVKDIAPGEYLVTATDSIGNTQIVEEIEIKNIDDKEVLDYLQENNPLLRLLIQKQRTESNFKRDQKESGIEELIRNQHVFVNGPFQSVIYLTSLTNQECDDLKLETGYIHLNALNIKNEWGFIDYIGSSGCKKKVQEKVNPGQNPDDVFDSWSKFDNLSHPLRDIVIADEYLLVNKKNQKIEDNFIPLIHKLIGAQKNDINLTILTKNIPGDNDVWRNGFACPNLILMSAIKNTTMDRPQTSLKAMCLALEQLIDRSNVNVRIARYPDPDNYSNLKKIKGRFLITNYLWLESSNSFTYFPFRREDDFWNISIENVLSRQGYKEKQSNLISYNDYLQNIENGYPIQFRNQSTRQGKTYIMPYDMYYPTGHNLTLI